MIFHRVCQAYQKPHVLFNVLYDLVSGSKGCTKCLMDEDELNLRNSNRGQNDGHDHDASMQTKMQASPQSTLLLFEKGTAYAMMASLRIAVD
jgi:hypothetical protein